MDDAVGQLSNKSAAVNLDSHRIDKLTDRPERLLSEAETVEVELSRAPVVAGFLFPLRERSGLDARMNPLCAFA